MEEEARSAESSWGRRWLLLAMVVLALPLLAAHPLPRPAADFKASPIHWTLPSGAEAHGYMAVPDRAHGPQPAVLLIGDTAASDLDNRLLVRALAQAGFVACTLNRDQPADDAIVAGTLRWLGGNRYATGRVALLGIGGGGLAVERLLADRRVQVGAAIDPAAMRAWTQADGTRLPGAAPLDWNAAWTMVTSFLREHLSA